MKTALIITLSLMFLSCSSQLKEETKKENSKALNKVAEKAKSKIHWGYSGLIGPDMWSSLKADYKLCKEGKVQSPINLVWQRPKQGGMLKFYYSNSPFSIKNLGNGLQVTMHSEENFARIRGKKYQLRHINFHFPSEHQLSGKSFAGEIQFFHQDKEGDWAVVSSLVAVGDHLQNFDILLSHFPEQKMVPIKVYSAYFNPDSLMPARKTYYNYNGSLTTPPCSEGIDWNVLNTSIEISQAQFDKFKSYVKNNNRPIQPPNNRKVINYR